jgi:hypothetical protein
MVILVNCLRHREVLPDVWAEGFFPGSPLSSRASGRSAPETDNLPAVSEDGCQEEDKGVILPGELVDL